MFNPLKYQFSATYLRDQNEQALLQIRRGNQEESFLFPKGLLPPEIAVGTNFVLNLQPEEVAKQNESEVLKQLLSELVR